VSDASRPRNFTPLATVPPEAVPAVPSWRATRSVITDSMVSTPPMMTMSLATTLVRLTALLSSTAVRAAVRTLPTLRIGGATVAG
jgi:hypothetical protein